MSNYSTTQQLLSYGNVLFNISSSAADSSNETLATDIVEGWFEEIGAKCAAGFNISVSDVFAFVLGSEFIFNQSIPGLNAPLMARTWSDVRGYSGFAQALYPMPIVMANEVVPPGIPNVTEFYGVLLPAYNSSNDTIVGSTIVIR
jgi:Lysophospholipase catalytic domain